MNYLRDSHGNVVGRVETLGGVQRVYDSSGRLQGTYNQSTNTTTNASGSSVVRDNQLLSLLRK